MNTGQQSSGRFVAPQARKVGVIGLGNWGTAICHHLAVKGYDVLGWGREDAVIQGVNCRRINPVYLSSFILHEGVKATSSIEQVVERDIVIMVFPSAFLSEIVPQMKVRPQSVVVSAIKGLDGASLLTPLQYFEHFGPPCAALCVLSGPSFAKDIAAQRPAGVVAASALEEAARFTADLFANERLKVYTSTDPLGVEIGGIVKNVIALAAGVCDGLNLGDSARAGLITRGLAEMTRLARAMGADPRTLSGLSGLGDLVMTATCDASRNRTVGLRLGQGEDLKAVVETLGSVAEGVETTSHVLALAQKFSVEMPITHQVARLLGGEVTPAQVVRLLVGRPMRREVE